MNHILYCPSFVIHLTRSNNRDSYFKKNIKNAGFTNLSIFEGVDGKDENQVKNALSLFQNPPIDTDAHIGQVGCLLSHMKLWKHIIDHKIELSTIFEDDIVFHPQWKTHSKEYYDLTPKNYDILFIGNQLDSCLHLKSNTHMITTEPVYCTHAYIITLEGAKKLLNSILYWDYKQMNKNGLCAIDVIIKDIQTRCLTNEMPTTFSWYSWNGTKYPCEYNRLPIKEKTCRNTGLVFQNREFISLIHNNPNYNLETTTVKRYISKPIFTQNKTKQRHHLYSMNFI